MARNHAVFLGMLQQRWRPTYCAGLYASSWTEMRTCTTPATAMPSWASTRSAPHNQPPFLCASSLAACHLLWAAPLSGCGSKHTVQACVTCTLHLTTSNACCHVWHESFNSVIMLSNMSDSGHGSCGNHNICFVRRSLLTSLERCKRWSASCTTTLGMVWT